MWFPSGYFLPHSIRSSGTVELPLTFVFVANCFLGIKSQLSEGEITDSTQVLSPSSIMDKTTSEIPSDIYDGAATNFHEFTRGVLERAARRQELFDECTEPSLDSIIMHLRSRSSKTPPATHGHEKYPSFGGVDEEPNSKTPEPQSTPSPVPVDRNVSLGRRRTMKKLAELYTPNHVLESPVHRRTELEKTPKSVRPVPKISPGARTGLRSSPQSRLSRFAKLASTINSWENEYCPGPNYEYGPSTSTSTYTKESNSPEFAEDIQTKAVGKIETETAGKPPIKKAKAEIQIGESENIPNQEREDEVAEVEKPIIKKTKTKVKFTEKSEKSRIRKGNTEVDEKISIIKKKAVPFSQSLNAGNKGTEGRKSSSVMNQAATASTSPDDSGSNSSNCEEPAFVSVAERIKSFEIIQGKVGLRRRGGAADQ